MLQTITKDIMFDGYGDISIYGNDIVTLNDMTDIIHQNILFRISSEYGDLPLNKEFGANLRSLIGMTNMSEAEALAKRYIMKALTSDNFLLPNELIVVCMGDKDVLYIRISVISPLLHNTFETIRINATFNTFTGQLNVIK